MESFLSFDNQPLKLNQALSAYEPIAIVHLIDSGSFDAQAICQSLSQNGFYVVTCKPRANNFLDSVKDVAFLARHFKTQYPTLNYYILGMGDGSFIAQVAAFRFGHLIDAAVLDSRAYINRAKLYLQLGAAQINKNQQGETLAKSLLSFYKNNAQAYVNKKQAIFIADSNGSSKLYNLYKHTGFDNVTSKKIYNLHTDLGIIKDFFVTCKHLC